MCVAAGAWEGHLDFCLAWVILGATVGEEPCRLGRGLSAKVSWPSSGHSTEGDSLPPHPFSRTLAFSLG